MKTKGAVLKTEPVDWDARDERGVSSFFAETGS